LVWISDSVSVAIYDSGMMTFRRVMNDIIAKKEAGKTAIENKNQQNF